METTFVGSKVYEEFDKKVKDEYDRIINDLIKNGD